MILTTNEFAALHEVDYAVAAGTLKFLLAKGIVTEAGSRPNPTGKGKPSALFNVPETATVTLKAVEKVAA